MQHEVHLGIDFWWIWIDFRTQVGVEKRPNIDGKRCRKSDQKKEGNKMTKKSLQDELRRGAPFYGGLRPGPGPPWGGGKGEGWINGLEAARSRTPMGQRPGEF